MLRTSKAPWAARRVSKAEMRAVIQLAMLGKPCWRVGKYLGSMLFFDFGDRIAIPSMRGGVIQAGQATVGIRNVYWELMLEDATAINSDRIDDDDTMQLTNLVQGTELVDLTSDRASKFLSLTFSNGVILRLDTTNRYATPDYIAEFTLHDGRIYSVTPRGNIVLSNRVSTARREAAGSAANLALS